jgi:hypothetical protein
MKDLLDIKNLLIDDLIEIKRTKIKIYNQTQKERRKEKKRQLIEKIKEERLKNSIILDNF